MGRRTARVSVLLCFSAVLVGTMIPSAQATTSGKIELTGQMNVAAGLAYSCVDNGVATHECPPPVGNPPTNNLAVTFGASGPGTITQKAKVKCPGTANTCAEAGTWVVSANGAISGKCELWSGNINGSITPSLSTGTKNKNRTFNLTLTAVDGEVVGTGTTDKDETIVAKGTAKPNTLQGSTCTNKNAKSLIVALSLTIGRS